MEAAARKSRRRSDRKAGSKSQSRRRLAARRRRVRLAFGRTHFGAANLADKRRTDRLVKVADQIMAHPAGTLPQKLKNPSDLEALYRLANTPTVTHAAVTASHHALTRQAMADHGGTLLLVHDTTELDYSGLRATQGLGPIGNGTCRGYLCHNSLAVEPATRRVLGLANQILHTRRKVPRHETPARRRDHPDRESRLWKCGCGACVLPPPGVAAPMTATRVIDVCDAGADAFELFDYERANGRWFLIRAGKDRWTGLRPPRLLGGEEARAAESVKLKLYAYTRRLEDLGGRYVSVSAGTNKRNGKNLKLKQTARLAKVRIAAGPVALPVPVKPRGEHADAPLNCWVVHVREVDPPPGQNPLEWVLLTNVPADTLEQAAERVDWYACRATVEEYHKAMKSGCGIEQLQFMTRAALEPMIGLLSIAAVALLQLRQAARRPDAKDTPATTFVPRDSVRVLSAWRLGRPKMDMSVYDFYLALARLGGHQNRKSDGPPGWLTLWRGFNDLQLMLMGVYAMRLEKCDER
ncbi:MAG: IS4 family transposase [Terriglobales bacterium]